MIRSVWSQLNDESRLGRLLLNTPPTFSRCHQPAVHLLGRSLDPRVLRRVSRSFVMFFLVQRAESVALSPKFFGKNIARDVEEALRTKVEGKCTGRWGFTSQTRHARRLADGEGGGGHPRALGFPC